MKRNTWKKTIAFVLAFTLVAGAMPANVGGFLTGGTEIVARAEVTSGTWGNGINYSYDSETGTLTLTKGTGTVVKQSEVVFNWNNYSFNSQFSGIRKIVISEGITQIDFLAFADWRNGGGFFENDITVEIPSTVTNIGQYAFSSMTYGSLSVVMNRGPEGLTIAVDAFTNAENGTFTTPYADDWKTAAHCTYTESTNTLKIGDNRYYGAFTLEAATATPLTYMVWNDENKQLEQQTLDDSITPTTVTESTYATWGTADTETWYVVSGADVTLSDRITVTGTVNLILKDGAKLTASKGIRVPENATLNIYGQSAGTGELSATNNRDCAGIGGDYYESGGTVTINGGTVTATGAGQAAGIGGGFRGNGGTIAINGGTVTATGGTQGAGIGGGRSGDGADVTINGGTVTATSPDSAAGIGGGSTAAGGTVKINGGTVTATGGTRGAGIGGGFGGDGGTVTISGGTVTATGGTGGAGIGGGISASEQGTVTINNGLSVKAGANAANAQKVTDFATIQDYQYVKIDYAEVAANQPLVIKAGDKFKVSGEIKNITINSSNLPNSTINSGTVFTVAKIEQDNCLQITTEDYSSTRLYFGDNSAKTYLVEYSSAEGGTLTFTENKVYKSEVSAPDLHIGDVIAPGAVVNKGTDSDTSHYYRLFVNDFYAYLNEGNAEVKSDGIYGDSIYYVTGLHQDDMKILDSLTSPNNAYVYTQFKSEDMEGIAIFNKYYFAQTHIDLGPEVVTPPTANNRTYDDTEQALLATAGTASDGAEIKYGKPKTGTRLIEQTAGQSLQLDIDDIKIGDIYKPTDANGIYFPRDYKVKFGEKTLQMYNGSTPVKLFKANNGVYQLYGGKENDQTLDDSRDLTSGNDALKITSIDKENKIIEVEEIDAYLTLEWSAGIPNGEDAGSYTVYYKAVKDDESSAVGSVTVTIAKATPTPTVSIDNWTYGETAKTPSLGQNSNPGIGDVTYEYKVKDATDETYSETVPTNAGNYTVKATVAQTTNYNGGTATANFTIAKGNPLVKAPTSKNPTHYSSAVQLVNAGTTATEECKLYYLVADTKPKEDADGWSTAIPTANAQGTYKVWYKVTVTGNTNYADTAVCETPVTVTVSQYTAPSKSSQTWTLTMDSYDYDGTAHEPTINGTTRGTVTYTYYNADTDEELDEAPSAIGNYKVKVYASGNNAYNSRSLIKTYSITDPIDKNGMANVDAFKANGTVPASDGKIFAGWFTDETCTTAYTEDTGKAYAKFIDEKILTVKAQISSGTTVNSEKTSIRFITSVDSLKYQNVGFKITCNGKTIDRKMTKVYTAINAGGAKVKPTVFSEDSRYMEAYTLNNITKDDYGKEFTVTPYYTTQDGTIVEGATNTFTIANMIK